MLQVELLKSRAEERAYMEIFFKDLYLSHLFSVEYELGVVLF